MRGRAHVMRGPLIRMRVYFFLLGFKSPVGDPVVKQWDEKHRKEDCYKHAAEHAGAHGVTRTGTCATGNGEGQTSRQPTTDLHPRSGGNSSGRPSQRINRSYSSGNFPLITGDTRIFLAYPHNGRRVEFDVFDHLLVA